MSGPGVVSTLLALAVIAQCGALLLRQRASGVESVAMQAALPQAAVATPLGIVVRSIVNAHLFGAAEGADGADAAPADADLLLQGVAASEDGTGGFAIIAATPARTARFYVVGQQLPGGSIVRAIRPDRVLLEHDGVIQALLLPHAGRDAGAPGQLALSGETVGGIVAAAEQVYDPESEPESAHQKTVEPTT